MVAGSFSTQFSYFKLRNDASWFDALPAISVEIKKSASNLSGNYTIVYPNPSGIALDYFTHFDNQEFWFAHIPTSTMYRVMSGQINAISPTQKLFLQLDGRGLNGLLTDIKVSASWVDKTGDFILCDPTFGVIPLYLPNVNTWKAFTDDYDKFDYWDNVRWDTQSAWTDIIDGELEIYGDAGEDRIITGLTAYNFETLEFRVKVSAASNTVRFGFKDAGGTQYVQFTLDSDSVDCENSDGSGSQSTSTPDSVTQTNYNYYRLEWTTDSVRFFVNGVVQVVETSNIPLGNLYPFIEVDESAETVTVDYVKMIVVTTNFNTYVARDKIGMDVVEEVTSIGNSDTDFTFFIDDDFGFNAYSKESVSSGYSFGYNSTIYTDPYQKISSLEENDEAKDLYNYIKVTGGIVLTTVDSPNWTDQFVGDGTQTTWALGYAAKKPLTLVQVDGVTKTEDTDFTVTYATESAIIKFNTAPANGKSVNIRYDYYTPIIATVSNDISIVKIYFLPVCFSHS